MHNDTTCCAKAKTKQKHSDGTDIYLVWISKCIGQLYNGIFCPNQQVNVIIICLILCLKIFYGHFPHVNSVKNHKSNLCNDHNNEDFSASKWRVSRNL